MAEEPNFESEDYYAILGVAKDATQETIRKAYKNLIHKYHEDRPDGDKEKAQRLNESYAVLSDADKRAQYDKFGREKLNNIHYEAMNQVVILYEHQLNRVLEHGGVDLNAHDFKRYLARDLRTAIDQAKQNRNTIERELNQLNKGLKRWRKANNSTNASPEELERVLRNKIEEKEESLRKHQYMEEVANLALEMVQDLEYILEEGEPTPLEQAIHTYAQQRYDNF